VRRLHALVAVAGAVIVLFMAVTGFLLALQPMVDAAVAVPGTGELTVAHIAAVAAENVAGLERIVRSASGQVVAYGFDGTMHTAVIIDPDTGGILRPYSPSPLFAFITELHRSLFLGATGRAGAALAAVAVLMLAATGMLLLLAKLGGWGGLFGRARGGRMQRWHTDLARVAVALLMLTGLTGAYMSATYFELLPSGEAETFSFPPSGVGTAAGAVASLQGLAATPLSHLRELIFPAPTDLADVFTMTTATGKSYVDQATGDVLLEEPNTVWQRIYNVIYLLHTGEGVWPLAAILGLGALAVLALAATGLTIWWLRRRHTAQIDANASPRDANTVILVGSETGTTWGFAATLQRALSESGHCIHVASLNEVRRDYPKADLLLILTATYGDGAAPTSARQFLSRLERLSSRPTFAVLGFGDQSFPQFCSYAAQVDAALVAHGLVPLMPTYGIDRQSVPEFRAWGEMLGEKLAIPLELSHEAETPRTRTYELVEREVYGVEIQAPVAILRFRTHRRPGESRMLGWWRSRLPAFEVGDLLGVVPPGSTLPRYYSLASARRDGVIEICVRSQASGLCSNFLNSLMPADTIEAFVRTNVEFRPDQSRRPLILVGAGSGVAPLVGFVRHNSRHRPVHLFFGARDPSSDFLYRDELYAALSNGRLTTLTTAFSRTLAGSYVQREVAADAERVRQLVAGGAQIIVCGGRGMARGVREALDTCLAPLSLGVDELRRRGRYLEDAY
jgi:sulfite reductase (NADPH) flavoprotein alpha-component